MVEWRRQLKHLENAKEKKKQQAENAAQKLLQKIQEAVPKKKKKGSHCQETDRNFLSYYG